MLNNVNILVIVKQMVQQQKEISPLIDFRPNPSAKEMIYEDSKENSHSYSQIDAELSQIVFDDFSGQPPQDLRMPSKGQFDYKLKEEMFELQAPLFDQTHADWIEETIVSSPPSLMTFTENVLEQPVQLKDPPTIVSCQEVPSSLCAPVTEVNVTAKPGLLKSEEKDEYEFNIQFQNFIQNEQEKPLMLVLYLTFLFNLTYLQISLDEVKHMAPTLTLPCPISEFQTDTELTVSELPQKSQSQFEQLTDVNINEVVIPVLPQLEEFINSQMIQGSHSQVEQVSNKVEEEEGGEFFNLENYDLNNSSVDSNSLSNFKF